MTSKTISVTEKVYNLLKKMKLPHESFGDTIERLCKNFSADNLRKWFETTEGWADMNDKEFEEVYGTILRFQRNLKPHQEN
ncbi:MAG: antitoxin VapB family protein [Candidatus Helarchaeota archaeon]